jgi:hydrogenase maturation protease
VKAPISSNSNKVIVALGNQLKGDDAVAIEVCKLLDKKFNVLFAYTSPDSFLGKIKEMEPKNVFFVDAALFEGNIGDVKLINNLKSFESSTHAFDFNLLKELLSPAKVYFIGINIIKTEYSDSISGELKKKLPKIANDLENLLLRIVNY